jgi:hypothetical protein
MGYSKYSHGVLTLQHDLAAMRIAELKQLCLAHGLKRTGVKVFQVLTPGYFKYSRRVL